MADEVAQTSVCHTVLHGRNSCLLRERGCEEKDRASRLRAAADRSGLASSFALWAVAVPAHADVVAVSRPTRVPGRGRGAWRGCGGAHSAKGGILLAGILQGRISVAEADGFNAALAASRYSTVSAACSRATGLALLAPGRPDSNRCGARAHRASPPWPPTIRSTSASRA